MAATKVKGIIFDLDGVIIDSLSVMRMAFEAACREVYADQIGDFETLFDQYKKHLGKGFGQIMKEMDLSEELYQPFKKHSEYLARYVYLYPGCVGAFEELHQLGIKLAIVTGKDTERAKYILEQLQIHSYFDFVVGSDIPLRSKPAPDGLLWVKEEWQFETDELIFIGDAEADMGAGFHANIKTVFARWGYGNPTEFLRYSPSFELDSWTDLVEFARSPS